MGIPGDEESVNETSNVNRINDIYRRWLPTGGSGAPRPGDKGPQAVLPVDRVTISDQAHKEDCSRQAPAAGLVDEQELAPEEKQQLNDLKQRDTEVKAHEQAHMASGGGLVQGGATYEYQAGPDGKMYAVGGEVSIDLSPERTPEATIRKMQQVRRAALAPSQPSGQDRAVAAQASQIEAQARMEKSQHMDEGYNGQDRAADSTAAPDRTAAPPTPYRSFNETRGSQLDLMI